MPEDRTVTRDRRRRFSRQLVPHPSYGWFMRRAIAGSLALATVLAGVVWLYHRQLLRELLASGFIPEEARRLTQGESAALARIAAFALLLLVVGVALLTSHLISKICGPVYRLSVDLQEALDHPEKRVQVRRDDQCQDVVRLVNTVLDARHRPPSEDR